MSLLHSPVILPPPKDRTAELQHENAILGARVSELQTKLYREQERNGELERAISSLRTSLTPLYQALQHVFGEFEGVGIDQSAPSSATPQVKAIWNDWKAKLGGMPARAIDAMLLHGAMNRTQLRIHLKCANGSVTNVIVALNKAGLINKNGKLISLKEL